MIRILSKEQFDKKVGENITRYSKRTCKLPAFQRYIYTTPDNEEIEFNLTDQDVEQPVYFEYEDIKDGIMGNYAFIYLYSVDKLILPVSKENIPNHLEVDDILDWIIIETRDLDSIDLNETIEEYWEFEEYKSIKMCEKEKIKVPAKHKFEISKTYESFMSENPLPEEGRYTITDKLTGELYRVWIKVNDPEVYYCTKVLCYLETQITPSIVLEIILKISTKKYKYERIYN